MRALYQAVSSRVERIEEDYKKARTDSLFATETSSKINTMILQLEDTLARLKTQALTT